MQLSDQDVKIPSQLQRKFKKILGLSIYAYLSQLRMQQATRLLKKTSYSIIEISVLVGYESHAAFSRHFNKIFGISPLAYRKKSPDY